MQVSAYNHGLPLNRNYPLTGAICYGRRKYSHVERNQLGYGAPYGRSGFCVAGCGNEVRAKAGGKLNDQAAKLGPHFAPYELVDYHFDVSHRWDSGASIAIPLDRKSVV